MRWMFKIKVDFDDSDISNMLTFSACELAPILLKCAVFPNRNYDDAPGIS